MTQSGVMQQSNANSWRFSLASLFYLIALLGVSLGFILTQLRLASVKTELNDIQTHVFGLQETGEQIRFKVAGLGGGIYQKDSPGWSYPVDFGGVFMISLSDRSDFELQLEYFDGVNRKANSYIVPMRSPQIAVSIQNISREFSSTDERAINLISPAGDDVNSFYIPYRSYLSYQVSLGGVVDGNVILAIAFFNKRQKKPKVTPWLIDGIGPGQVRQMAIDEKLTVVFFRFVKKNSNEAAKKILQRETGSTGR